MENEPKPDKVLVHRNLIKFARQIGVPAWMLKEVVDQHIDELRERIGQLPDAETWEAFYAGKLTEEENERMRDFVVCYPDVAIVFCAPFPSEEDAGDELTDEQVEQHLREFQRRIAKLED